MLLFRAQRWCLSGDCPAYTLGLAFAKEDCSQLGRGAGTTSAQDEGASGGGEERHQQALSEGAGRAAALHPHCESLGRQGAVKDR